MKLVAKSVGILSLIAVITFGFLMSSVAIAFDVPGENELVSKASDGISSDEASSFPEISADGRFVAFESEATTLVAGDTNGRKDIFLRDRENSTTIRVSISSKGEQANHLSHRASISGDGRYVVFESYASNLVDDDTNSVSDVFIHDRLDQTTKLVSGDMNNEEGNNGSFSPDVSANGRYVVFSSRASNLVPGVDPHGIGDQVFKKDMVTGEIVALSVAESGDQGNGRSLNARVSCDGSVVVFGSRASNLVPNDTNDSGDLFVSVEGADGHELHNFTKDYQRRFDLPTLADISCDGNFIALEAYDSGFVENDTNDIRDVFVYDRNSDSFESVTIGEGFSGGGTLMYPRISGNGRFVSFNTDRRGMDSTREKASPASTTTYVHDRELNVTRGVVVDANDELDPVWGPAAISNDGNFVAHATSWPLVMEDINLERDVYVSKTGVLIDSEAPVVSSLNWTENPLVEGHNTVLSAAVTDDVSGVDKVEYFIGNDPGQGNGFNMDFNGGVASATMGAGLTPSVYEVSVRAQDNLGNWSDSAQTELVVRSGSGSVLGLGRIMSDGGDRLPDISGNNATGQFAIGVTYVDTSTLLGASTFTYGENCVLPWSSCFRVNIEDVDWLAADQSAQTATFQGTAELILGNENLGNEYIARVAVTKDEGSEYYSIQIYDSGIDPAAGTPIYRVSGELSQGGIWVL